MRGEIHILLILLVSFSHHENMKEWKIKRCKIDGEKYYLPVEGLVFCTTCIIALSIASY